VAQTVSHRPLTAEIQLQTQGSQYGICGTQSGTATDVSPSNPISRSLYHFTIAPHSFIHSFIYKLELSQRQTNEGWEIRKAAFLVLSICVLFRGLPPLWKSSIWNTEICSTHYCITCTIMEWAWWATTSVLHRATSSYLSWHQPHHYADF